MFKVQIVLLCVLLTSVDSTVTLNTNYTEMSTYCQGTPYWKLNLCNISCSTCSSSDYNQCSSCENNFTLSNNYCSITNNTYTFIYLSYFTSTSINSSDLTLWTDDSTSKNLSVTDTVSVCSNTTGNSYRFQMLGLFGVNNDVFYQAYFTDEFSYITLKFNLLLLVNSATLYVKLGEEQMFSKTYNTLADLAASYYKSSNSSTTNYLNINSLTSSNVRTVIQEVSIDLAILTNSITLHFICTAPTPSNFWAISDFTILLRECESCPKSALLSEISILGKVIGYTSAFLVPALIIFIIIVKMKDYLRLRKREQLLGGRSLPIKSIKRVINMICGLGQSKKARTSADDRRSKGLAEILQPLKQQNMRLTKSMSVKQENKNK